MYVPRYLLANKNEMNARWDSHVRVHLGLALTIDPRTREYTRTKNSLPISIVLLSSTMSNAAEDREETTPNAADEAGDLIDHNTFDQLLEMDDEDDREFSRSIVWNYFEQADTTFVEMETALSEKDLDQLSSLGHFLKGSSAALGLTKVKASCERIQHFGAKKDESGTEPIDEETAMKRIEEILPVVKQEYAEAEKYLRKFYGDDA
ncbi:hypothetical protein G7K_6183-t1 [Saitoella complicata NRRL Y-17804]|uniref:HPt domain-containing protein n=2 Tax=Saitoella complicata (strain BCRC 22490 / CBS 7301 / JCM 7358 / NBRC 10748 / NRRL Y-17804) TaxID=698492 RepID=A0A0E9NQE3_SAICN|nr:hypothetical protein G7K_6183-t1 [Saitoella complicata NRRL Y-17804]